MNLIICGSKWDTEDNALYGFVSSSWDGGRTWHTTLEDRHSAWVSEQSCAVGVDGKVYFVSEAANVVDGTPHPESGTTRIFSSSDSGRTWRESAKTGWADHSASVVAQLRRTGQNRLYLFFNRANWKNHAAPTSVALVTYQIGRSQVSKPLLSQTMGSRGFQGTFPRKAMVLKSGEVLSLYRGTLRAENGTTLVIGTVRLNPKHGTLFDSTAVQIFAAKGQSCFIDESEAYDRWHDRLYIAYHQFADNTCKFMIVSSADGGSTWSTAREIPPPDTAGRGFHNPAMAVNAAGNLGLMWRDTPNSDCWYFSVSVVEGEKFLPAKALSSTCASSPDKTSATTDAYVASVLVQADPSEPLSGPTLRVINHQDAIFRNTSALTATGDRVFHAVWVENNSGQGELRTAALITAEDATDTNKLLLETPAKKNLGNELALQYAGDQHYDDRSGDFTVTMALRNRSSRPIVGPIYVRVRSLSSESGRIEVRNADNGKAGLGAFWKVNAESNNEILKPSRTTSLFRLVFHLTLDGSDRPKVPAEMISVRLELLGTPGSTRSSSP